jgi:hypothetical protein
MIKEEETGKKLADHFALLSQSVGVFNTQLKAQLEGINLTGLLRASATSSLEEIQKLKSDLDLQYKIVGILLVLIQDVDCFLV